MAQVGFQPIVNPPRAIVRLRDGDHVFDWNRGIMMAKHVFVRGRQTTTNNTTVIEKRAPTDESVKLLREMERDAREEVTKALRLTNNHFDGVLHVVVDSMSQAVIWTVAFDLNGKRIEVEHTEPRHEQRRIGVQNVVDGLHAKIATKIASEVLGKLISEADLGVL